MHFSKEMASNLTNNGTAGGEGYRLARKVHLAITIFNKSTAGVVCYHKMLCLSGGIAGLYLCLRLILVQPVHSMLFFAFAFDGTVFFTVMWGNAFLIPVLMKELKDQILMAAGGAVHHRQYLRRVLRSIPCVGVSVGGFRNMGRDSTLIFVDFLIRNVVSLLLTF